MRKVLLALVALILLTTGSSLAVPAAGAATNVTLFVELNEWMSCPFLFTWDGQDYRMENDIYSVARGPSGEFIDYLFIQNPVQAKDGAYQFQVREVPSEKSYTDMVKLMVIDHPAGVSVGVDSSGKAHSYANPLPPATAVDGNGMNVLAALAARDNAGVSMFHNDAVTLDFNEVDITKGAKLVLRVDGFEGSAKGDVIRETPAIKIQTQEAGAWVTRHVFLPKEVAAEGVFDLKPYLAESRLVRLQSLSCLSSKYHVVDFAALDNTTDTLSYAVLEPSSAVLNGTTDVLSSVRLSDNNYAFTEQEDIVVVSFPFQSLAGEKRDFAFVSEGYYEMSGNSYYVDTWNGSSWVQRGSWMLYSQGDQLRSLNIGPYLPDPAGEYKLRLRNQMTYYPQYAYVDWVYLVADGVTYYPYYARESDSIDILSTVTFSDDVKWYSMNKWAVIKFNLTPPNRAPTTNPVSIDNPTSPTPTISWTYNDAEGNAQTQYEVEVWSGAGGTGTNMWNPAVSAGAATSVVYGGSALVNGQTYYARVKAFDGNSWGVWFEASWMANLNRPPVANPGGPYNGSEGSPIAFNGTGSSDPDGDALTYSWNFGDTGTSSGPTPSHTYLDNGTYMVTLTVTDTKGSTVTATTATIIANVAPAVNAGPDQTVNLGAAASFSGSFTDPGADTHTIAWSFGDSGTASGTLTPSHVYLLPGTYTVTLTVTDDDAGAGTDTLQVTVVDTTPPTITAPANVTVNTDAGQSYATNVALGQATASDNSGSVNVTSNAAAQFPLGVTTVTWTATDGSGNTATATQIVSVLDREPPRITAPANLTVEQTSPAGAIVTALGTPTVTDNADPAPVVTNNAPPVFPPGVTTITWTARDAAGNTATATQTVTVRDTTPPVVTITGPLPNAVFAAGDTINVQYTTQDAVDPNPAVTVTPSNPVLPPLNPGTLVIRVQARDAAGNTGAATVTVTIKPVAATVNVDPDTLNKKSSGNWITAYIELPQGYSAADIDGASVKLNGTVPAYLGKEGWAKAESNSSNTADYDNDGILERMVKFDRAAVQAILSAGDNVQVTVAGKFRGIAFEGMDIIKVTK